MMEEGGMSPLPFLSAAKKVVSQEFLWRKLCSSQKKLEGGELSNDKFPSKIQLD
jgi:hypothetical protein